MGGPATSEEWRRPAIRRFVVPAVLAVVGLVLILVAEAGDTVWIIGSAVLGLAGVLAVGFVFLEVGYSEDRARARERPGSGPRYPP